MDHRSSGGERTVADDAPLRGTSDRTAECSEQPRAVPPLDGRSAPTLVLLLLITALGLGLRLYRIGSEGLWIDEAFSIWLARHSVVEMVDWVGEVDHHPPLYYLLLKGWTAVVGTSEGAARALSAVFGTLTIPALYLLGRTLVDARVGLLAAMIVALSPFHVRFAQETRMYTLLTLFACLALHAFGRVQRRRGWQAHPGGDGPRGQTVGSPGDSRWRSGFPWAVYVVATAGMLWTHNMSVFLPIALNVVVGRTWVMRRAGRHDSGLVRGAGRWLRKWAAVQGAVLLLWLPWLPSFISQAVEVYGRFWLPAATFERVISVVGVYLCDCPSWPVAMSLAVSLLLGGLALVGWWALRREGSGAGFLGLMTAMPFMGAWVVSQWRPILSARTLMWTSLSLYVAMASGVSWFWTRIRPARVRRKVTGAVIAALIAVNAGA